MCRDASMLLLRDNPASLDKGVLPSSRWENTELGLVLKAGRRRQPGSPSPASTHHCQAPGHLTCHPDPGSSQPSSRTGKCPHPELSTLGAIHPWVRKAPAHTGEFRGTQKAAGVYLHFQCDCPTSPCASDWMGF